MVCQQMRVRFYTREVNLGLQIVVIDFACASIAASLLRDVGGKKLLHGVSWLHFWGAGRGAENVFFSVKILQPVWISPCRLHWDFCMLFKSVFAKGSSCVCFKLLGMSWCFGVCGSWISHCTMQWHWCLIAAIWVCHVRRWVRNCNVIVRTREKSSSCCKSTRICKSNVIILTKKLETKVFSQRTNTYRGVHTEAFFSTQRRLHTVCFTTIDSSDVKNFFWCTQPPQNWCFVQGFRKFSAPPRLPRNFRLVATWRSPDNASRKNTQHETSEALRPKRFSTRHKTRLNVAKCHSCHTKRSKAICQTSKSDPLCRTYFEVLKQVIKECSSACFVIFLFWLGMNDFVIKNGWAFPKAPICAESRFGYKYRICIVYIPYIYNRYSCLYNLSQCIVLLCAYRYVYTHVYPYIHI